MAITTYTFNKFKYELFNGLDLSDQDFSIMLTLGYSPSGENYISEISAHEIESNGTTNYIRQALSNIAISRDSVNNKTKITCNNILWELANFMCDGALIFINNGSDSTSIPVVYWGFGEVKQSQNTDFEIDWNVGEGTLFIQ